MTPSGDGSYTGKTAADRAVTGPINAGIANTGMTDTGIADTKASGTGMDRDVIADGHIQRLARERDGENTDILDEAELLASRRQFIPDEGIGDDLLVFGYGSLIWNPCIQFKDRFTARLFGFHRRFCLLSTIGRGSPEAPGLVLGLDYGGSVQGICFKVAQDRVAQEADMLWRREMLNASYLPKWVHVQTEKGSRRALTFIIDKDKPAYAPRMTAEMTADIIHKASGFVGSCTEYLTSTQQALMASGIKDPLMQKLVRLVEEKSA